MLFSINLRGFQNFCKKKSYEESQGTSKKLGKNKNLKNDHEISETERPLLNKIHDMEKN